MTSLKPSSITSFMASKPSTITTKRKPEVIERDADESPTRLIIGTTEKDGRLVDVEVGVPTKNVAGCVFGREVIYRRRMGPWGHYGRPAGQPGGQWPVPESPKK